LILKELLSSKEAYFWAYFRGLPVPCSNAIRGRDGFTRNFGCGRYENLLGAISWLTFFAGGAADSGEAEVIAREAEAGARQFTKH
jgi:hypothetical protein